MDISAVREGLAGAVEAHCQEATGIQCFGYVPETINPPTFYAGEATINNLSTFGQTDEVEIVCRVFTSTADDREGQRLLDQLLRRTGPTSVREALALARGGPGEAALGGACDDLVVVRIQGYRLYRIAETEFYGAEILVRAIGDGD